MIYRLVRQQIIPAPLAEVWAYFSNPNNLNELTPPDMHFEIRYGGQAEMYPGQILEYRVEFVRGIRSRWLTEIAHIQPQVSFVDEQRIGPYRFWFHEHTFIQVGAGVRMHDLVTYALPFGLIGDIVHWAWVKRRLNQIFDYRIQKIEQIFGPSPRDLEAYE